ncbi:MAG: hypothetical protein IPN86_17480 [Saprospiraceae bacterium]|nr:hypothetical protein [Saprospiraceae bacterium]
MKNVLILLFLVFCGVASGQIIDFPDPNFKNALVNTKCVDTDGNGSIDGDADLNNDGEIDVSEVLKVKRLNVDNQNIISLEGLTSLTIKDLLSLTSLVCSNNDSLQNLTLVNLPKLSTLNCSSTGLISLELKDFDSLNRL